MLKKYTFWLKAGITFQLLTGVIHSLSFLNNPQSTNDTEKQLLDLMNNYKMDLGAGFTPTMSNVMTSFSICFSLLLFFSGFLNLFLLRKKADIQIMKGIIGINVIAYSICFATMASLTFLPPIICVGLILAAFLLAFICIRNKTANP